MMCCQDETGTADDYIKELNALNRMGSHICAGWNAGDDHACGSFKNMGRHGDPRSHGCVRHAVSHHALSNCPSLSQRAVGTGLDSAYGRRAFRAFVANLRGVDVAEFERSCGPD
jgi:hypothetical protein